MIHYTVWVNDDRFEFDSERGNIKLEEIAERLKIREEDIVMVEDEEM